MVTKEIICPICGKTTLVRIQNGAYLDSYPIRINCMNCRALMKGVFKTKDSFNGELLMENAITKDADLDINAESFCRGDYVAEVSGELPCKHVSEYNGGIPDPIFLAVANYIESVEERIERLKHFNANMEEWKKTKSTAFQLLDEGSIEYISIALHNKLGEYNYECDNYLKSLHCLQEVVCDETKYLFLKPEQDQLLLILRLSLSNLDNDMLRLFSKDVGGIEGHIRAYRKVIGIISQFMNIYSNILPAETYIRFKNKENSETCLSTCSFSDIKTFYQDAYEALASLLHYPVCLDNIAARNDYQSFEESFNNVFCQYKKRDLRWYRALDNGTKINKYSQEQFQSLVELPANRLLRNGIGHNNIKYDGTTQVIQAFDMKKEGKITTQTTLMEMAVECIGLVKSAVIISEIILFFLRMEFRENGINTIIHPRFYQSWSRNDRCPCGSGKKYKKCCMREVEMVLDKGKIS